MSQQSWAQQVTDRFFSSRASPPQAQCDEIARSISGSSVVRPVDSPGSMSYTVICDRSSRQQPDLVVSFREGEARLGPEMVKLAKQVHGQLVPESTWHGNVEGADPPLFIYSMPYLRGSSCVEAVAFEEEMGHADEAKHVVLLKHLARYFARCWSSPQPFDGQARTEKQEGIRRRLARLAEETSSSVLPEAMLHGLIGALPSLFEDDSYPAVLTHGDFSVTNILVDEDAFEITGIVDWSLATVLPFGMDLDILFLTTGFMTLDGWHDYACKRALQDAFWGEFWAVTGIQDEQHRDRTRGLAEAAGRIGAILRLAFRRRADGSPSEEVLVSEFGGKQLKAWFGQQEHT